jgi:CPA2 family monovalent cation:H+ antiporter-2
MHGLDFLRDLVTILAASIVVVTVLRRLKVPTIAGFIVSGTILGPGGFALIADVHEVQTLAEVGVVLLLFGIGLELSLERLRRYLKAILIGGGVQVGATIVCAAAVTFQLGYSLYTSVFVGFVIAISSTAVVLRALSSRGELDTSHGRLSVGILVFQDLSVVPMMLLLPLLAGSASETGDVLRATTHAVLVLGGVLLAARFVVPRVLALVAATKERELFVMTVFLICFGTAWSVTHAGVSLALGAFLAGLVVAGSEFRHQALSELVPARELLAGIFFVSVGMLFDFGDIRQQLGATTLIVVGIMAGKAIVLFLTALLLRLPIGSAVLAAGALCQVGEFSFVLLGAAKGTNLVPSAIGQSLLLTAIVSMVLTPLAMACGPTFVRSLSRLSRRSFWRNVLDERADDDGAARGHAIVAGYGLAGRTVCRRLQKSNSDYMVVDINPENVRSARREGHSVIYGDITREDVLREAGVAGAALVCVSINDPRAAELAVRTIRRVNPQVKILVRAQYELDRSSLLKAGASLVVSAEQTASDALGGLAAGLAIPALEEQTI